MTNGQLYKAIEQNNYIVVRPWIGPKVAINCRATQLLCIKKYPYIAPHFESPIVSYYPCSFQEYITEKVSIAVA